jgi:hypothetical protein
MQIYSACYCFESRLVHAICGVSFFGHFDSVPRQNLEMDKCSFFPPFTHTITLSSHLKWHYTISSVNRASLRCTQTNEIDTLILDVSKMKQYGIPKNVHHFIFTQESNRMQCALLMHNARQASRHRDLNSPHCTVSHNNWVTFPRHVRKTIRTIILVESLAFGERNWSHGCRKGSCV